MHDPMVVAFNIPRPWPKRDRMHDAKPGKPERWKIRHHHVCSNYGCEAEHAGQKFFPWYRPGSYSMFWVLAGRGWYWTPLITVWHREPGGHDSGEICKHHKKVKGGYGQPTRIKVTNAWKWHVHHWHIQVPALQELRRTLLTRCEWCGGPSRKGDRVNVSHQWNNPPSRWWQGSRGLFHGDCSSFEHASKLCLCSDPAPIGTGMSYGRCGKCGKFCQPGKSMNLLLRQRLLASVPRGQRSPSVMAKVEELAGMEETLKRMSIVMGGPDDES